MACQNDHEAQTRRKVNNINNTVLYRKEKRVEINGNTQERSYAVNKFSAGLPIRHCWLYQ